MVLLLASQSPQRLALLQQLGFEPQCLATDVDETPHSPETPEDLVLRLAQKKARACAGSSLCMAAMTENDSECVVLAADTVIDLDGKILGKPQNQAHAAAMLMSLSNREHLVHSGVCVLEAGRDKVYTAVVTTRVRFTTISPETAREYWLSGEPTGKSGSYAIQGRGAQFVVHLSGSYSNVVGLPLFETGRLLARAACHPHALDSTQPRRTRQT